MLRAQKIKTKTNGAVIPVGGQTVSQFKSSRVLSDVVTYLSALVKTTLDFVAILTVAETKFCLFVCNGGDLSESRQALRGS